MPNKQSAISLTITCLILSACEHIDIHELESDIVNGTIDSGHLQVVRISQFDPTYPGGITEFCTGTLINNNTVLTARHCTQNYQGQNYANVVVEGTTLIYDRETGARYFEDYAEVSTNITRNNTADIALVRLPIAVRGVSFARLATGAPVGRVITLVGYGGTSATDPNWGQVKRFGSNTIDRVDPNYIYFDGATGSESATCYGDSGGPAFAGSTSSTCLVGVTKGQLATPSTACTEAGGEWYHTRVDTQLAWIASNANTTTCVP